MLHQAFMCASGLGAPCSHRWCSTRFSHTGLSWVGPAGCRMCKGGVHRRGMFKEADCA